MMRPCMSVAESQMLEFLQLLEFWIIGERVVNNKTGFVCENDEEFCLNTIKNLNDDKLWKKMNKHLIKGERIILNGLRLQKKWLKIIK